MASLTLITFFGNVNSKNSKNILVQLINFCEGKIYNFKDISFFEIKILKLHFMGQPYVKATKEIWDTHLVILQM
jgi:hypothetical protein